MAHPFRVLLVWSKIVVFKLLIVRGDLNQILLDFLCDSSTPSLLLACGYLFSISLRLISTIFMIPKEENCISIIVIPKMCPMFSFFLVQQALPTMQGVLRKSTYI